MDKLSISIDAPNMEEALRIGARALQIDRDQVVVVSSQQLSNGDFRFQLAPHENANLKSLDALLSSVESQLEDFETKGLVHGYSSFDLESNGLLNTDEESILSSLHEHPRKVGNIEFTPGVDYLECEEIKLFDSVWLESAQRTHGVGSEAQIAFIHELSPLEVKKSLIHPDDTGMLVELGVEHTVIMTKYPGRVLLVKGLFYLLPKDIAARFILHPVQNPMIVNANFIPPYGDGAPLSPSEVLARLEKEHIVFGLRHEDIETAITKSTSEHLWLQDICLARGMPPINGSDAKIELYFANGTGTTDFVVMPDGKIDYRKRTVIPMAHPGDMLAKVSLPSAGQPGMDIFGNMIDAQSGNPLPLFPGEGVRVSEDGREFWATKEGQITLGSDVLSVLPTYQVNGDVDYHSGNIEFDGNIIVTGSILTGFVVKAKGDLIVQGNIEAANVETGRDLLIQGGIIGNTSNPIKVGRNLIVHHMQNASVEVEGNVQVLHSSLHSSIETSGEFQCTLQKGALIGGSLVALKNAEVRILGSEAGTITKVILGQDFLVRKKIMETKQALDFLNGGIKKIEDYLAPLLNRISKENLIHSPEQVQRLKMIIERRKEMTAQQSLLKTRARRLENSAILQSGVKFKIMDIMYQDTKIQLSNVNWIPNEEMHAVELMLDSKTGKMKINRLVG